MNRLFGKSKPKEPGPSISDVIGGVCVYQKWSLRDLLIISLLGRFKS